MSIQFVTDGIPGRKLVSGDQRFYADLFFAMSKKLRQGKPDSSAHVNFVVRVYHLWDGPRIGRAIEGLVDAGILEKTGGRYKRPSLASAKAQKPKSGAKTKRCAYCRRRTLPQDQTKDHVIPRSRGGTDAASNLVICCFACNQMKSNRLPYEWAADILNFDRPKRKRESRTLHAIRRFQITALVFITSIRFWGTQS